MDYQIFYFILKYGPMSLQLFTFQLLTKALKYKFTFFFLHIFTHLHLHLKNATEMSLSRKHEPGTQDNLHTLLWAFSCWNYFMCPCKCTSRSVRKVAAEVHLLVMTICQMPYIYWTYTLEHSSMTQLQHFSFLPFRVMLEENCLLRLVFCLSEFCLCVIMW